MDSLTRLMREAAELGPERREVPGADQAHEVWRKGQRRRLVRVASATAATFAALTVVASLVLGSAKMVPDQLLPADRGGQGAGVTSYPQRIGHQWWATDLGDKADPIAALVQVGGEGERQRWEAVSPEGARRVIGGTEGSNDEVLAAVSPDGQRIANWEMAGDRYVLRDLRDGTSRSFTEFGSARFPEALPARRYKLAVQSPVVFSHSGEALVVPTDSGPVVIETDSGATRPVTGMNQAIGWIDDDRLVGRSWRDQVPMPDRDSGVEVMVWSRSTGKTTSLGTIALGQLPVVGFLDAQWWGTVRGDKTLWLSLTGAADGTRWLAGVSFQDLGPVDLAGKPAPKLTWTEVQRTDIWDDGTTGAGLAWRGDTPTKLSGGFDGRHVRPAVSSRSSEPTTVLDHSVGVRRIIWAQNALNGEPSASIFGTSTGWWTWWWQEIALGFLVLIAIQWWRHRRRPTYGVPTPWQSERRE